MNGNTTITVTFLFSIVSVIGVLYSIYNSNRSNRKQETEQQENTQEEEMKKAVKTAVEFAKINSKLDELCLTTKAIQLSLEKTDDELKKINITLSNHSQTIKDLEKFKTETMNRINRHEQEIIILKNK